MTPERKQIAFWLDPELVKQFEESENKTRVLNESLRMYLKGAGHRQEIEERVAQLEDFQNRFMAYFARTDNQPHSEFCDCETCKSSRRSFAPVVPLIPEPQSLDKITDLINRAITQAKQQDKCVVFTSSNFRFVIDKHTDGAEVYGRYLEFMDQNDPSIVSIKIPNPWLKETK